MNELKRKAIKVLSYIYGVGIFIALFIGALSFLGYVAAIVIGGQVATDMCVFIYKRVYPIIIYISTGSVLIGLLKMYVSGEKSLVFKSAKGK